MPIFERVLVAVDFSEHSRAALQLASRLASAPGAQLHLLHVYHPAMYMGSLAQPALPTAYRADVQAALEKELEELASSLDAPARVEWELTEGPPDREICAAARRIRADLIVMGTRGRSGVSHLVLGSVAERTLRAAPCPVLVTRGD